MKLFICLILIYQILICTSCGITTHTLIGNKALYWLKTYNTSSEFVQIITDNLDVFHASLMFPDWGYNCVIDTDNIHNASETAHWLPFQIASIEYLHETYTKPWNMDAKKLITFIFGVMSHSVADIIWHNLKIISKINEGFIEAIANSDFGFGGNPYSDNIHFIADVGGEFITSMQFDLNYLNNFLIPKDDIIGIYKRMGIFISDIELSVCMEELYTEVSLIKNFPNEMIYPYFSEKSPFLTDYFQDWWLGGINSLTTWTDHCWNNLAQMITNNLNKTTAACFVYQTSHIGTKNNSNRLTDLLNSSLIQKYNIIIQPKEKSCNLYQNYTIFRLTGDTIRYAFFGNRCARFK